MNLSIALDMTAVRKDGKININETVHITYI
jgi:hypothetical protein